MVLRENSPSVQYLRAGKTAEEVAALMNCHVSTARKRLTEAAAYLEEQPRRERYLLLQNCLDAVTVLQQSALAQNPYFGKRLATPRGRWDEVVLGLRRAA